MIPSIDCPEKNAPQDAPPVPCAEDFLALARRLDVASRGLEIAYAIGCPKFADALRLARKSAVRAKNCAAAVDLWTESERSVLVYEAESAEDHAWRARYVAAAVNGQVQFQNVPREEIRCDLMDLIALRAEGVEIPERLQPYRFPTTLGQLLAFAVMKA